MMIRFTLVSVGVLAFALQSCVTPKEVVKLKSQDSNIRWLNGHEQVLDSLDGIRYMVSFDQITDNDIIFDIEVVNRSNMPFLADPAEYFYSTDGSFHDTTDNVAKTFAYDPEKKLLDAELTINRSFAQAQNASIGALALAGVAIVSGISSDFTYDRHKSHRRSLTSVSSLAAANALAAGADGKNINTWTMTNVKDYWSNAALRKTTLDPGFYVNGKVLFPYNKNNKLYFFYFPVDGKYIVFKFERIQYKP